MFFRESLQYNLFKLLLIIIITSLLLIIITKHLLQPLHKLTNVIKERLRKIGNDTINTSNDEIAQLDESFSKFITIIDEKNEKLENFNTNLKIQIEQEIKKNQEKEKYMMYQNRLAQMGEMISMIAHQWRQPLSAISSTTNTLLLKSMMDKYEKEFFSEKLKNINDYSQHLSSTINDFRNFFKQNKEKRKISLHTVANDSLNIIKLSLESKNINIIKDFKNRDELNTYPNELRQVILNIIKNAEDILVEKTSGNKWIKLKTYKENGSHILEISDNGSGINENIIYKIFEPYYSTKKHKDGTGLGLYMSKTIIEDHCKGTLSVSNNEFGAVFKITLKDL